MAGTTEKVHSLFIYLFIYYVCVKVRFIYFEIIIFFLEV